MSIKVLSKVSPVPTDAFVASGGSHAPGFVPDPGSTSGSTKFLREDATWATPPGGSATPGGSDGYVQYNTAGAFDGSSGLTYTSGTSTLTAPNLVIGTAANGWSLTVPSGGGAASPEADFNVGSVRKAVLGYDGGQTRATFYNDTGTVGVHLFDSGAVALGTGVNSLSSNQLIVSGTADPTVQVNSNATGHVSLAVRAITSQSADLQQWQNSSGTALSSVSASGVFSGSGAGLTSIPESAVTNLTTDLAAKAPLASPTFTGTATVAHVKCSTAAPSAASSTGAGNGTPAVTVTGNDHAGTLAFTAGASAATAATVMTVTFAVTFGTAPAAVILTPANAATQALAVGAKPFVSAVSTTTFTVTSGGTALTNAGAYKWYYHVL